MRITLLTQQINNQKQCQHNVINFAGINKMLSSNNETIKFGKTIVSDVFESTGEDLNQVFERSINSIWRKIEEQSCTFTPQKLETAITEVKTVHPENSEEDILTVMQKLTQWANYSCFKPLTNELNDYDYKTTYKHSNNKLNDIFYYFLRRKRLCNLASDNRTFYSFVSKNNLKDISKSQKEVEFLSLEGFDDGVNFLTDDNKLAPLTNAFLSKVNELIHKKPNTSFNEAVDEVLNGKIKSTMLENNFYPNVISIENPPTRETILNQMSPIMPKSKDTIKKLIETVADLFEPHDKKENELLKTRIAQFYEQKIDIYSKQRLINLMKDMQEKISTFQKERNLPTENTYYLIYNHTKSYGIITQMFAKLNDIPENKIFYSMDDAHTLPINSTIVILDDLAISGDSLNRIKTHNLRDDEHVLFCTLIAHENALETKSTAIKTSKRSNNDHILNIITQKDKKPETNEEISVFDYFNKNGYTFSILGDNGYETKAEQLGECTVLSYMSPDNNAQLSSFILSEFLPTKQAIKNIHINFDNFEHKYKLNK